jgi:AcrR family transcriptional regulator
MNSMAISSPKVQDKGLNDREIRFCVKPTASCRSRGSQARASTRLLSNLVSQTGVAKTTIYRHWPSRADLLLDACAKMGSKIEPPDTGKLKEDLTILLTHLARELKSARWSSILPSIVDAAERDPDVATVYKKLHGDLMAPYRTVLIRAQERGEFSKEIRVSDILAMTVGALFYRRWYSREPITEKLVGLTLNLALASFEIA